MNMTGAAEVDATIREVRSAAAMRGAGAVQALDRALADLVARPTAAYIGPLLLLLDDEADYDEAMFSLIHVAEAFTDAEYVAGLLQVLSDMRARAPKWASIVLMRVLNSASARTALVRKLREADSPTKQASLWLCERINERSPTFLAQTTAVMLAAQTA
jgi:hypothetical protein